LLSRKNAGNTLNDAFDSVSPIGQQFVKDQKLRARLLAATEAGLAARQRAQRQVGAAGTARRLASDPVLRAELLEMVAQLQKARRRIEPKRSHKVRNVVLVIAGAGTVAAIPSVRNRLKRMLRGAELPNPDTGGLARSSAKTVEQEIEVDVPVTTAYKQWMQFEEFPSFMEGVDEVKRLDDTLLHWAATVGGKRAEWEAKVVEQEPNRRIAWESVGGKNTRGIVSFEEAGPTRTRIRLNMTYALDGVAEKAGAAAGIDDRRIRGDLRRFRDLIESRRSEPQDSAKIKS
jgi:uncharacterized membrane protein